MEYRACGVVFETLAWRARGPEIDLRQIRNFSLIFPKISPPPSFRQ